MVFPTLTAKNAVRMGHPAWAKLKELLRAAQARTREALEQAIGEALKRITPDNAKAWFRLCNAVYGIS